MTTTLKMLYASEVAITCGLDGLANSATTSRQSTVIDNTTNLYIDALVQLVMQTAAGALSVVPVIYVYAYGWSEGQGSNYTDTVSGSDSSYTLPSNLPPNLKLVQIISHVVAANTTFYSSPFTIAAAFGGILPPKWGIVVNNQTGLALSGTWPTSN